MLVADVTDSASDDCVVLDEKMPSEDLVKKAVSLQLPPTFFNYLDLPECPGCIGCRARMLTHPKSTMRVLRMLLHLTSGHVTLLPGKFHPP